MRVRITYWLTNRILGDLRWFQESFQLTWGSWVKIMNTKANTQVNIIRKNCTQFLVIYLLKIVPYVSEKILLNHCRKTHILYTFILWNNRHPIIAPLPPNQEIINHNPLGILARNLPESSKILQCTFGSMPLHVSSTCTMHFRWSFIFSNYGLYFLPGSNFAPFKEVKVPVSNSAEFVPLEDFGMVMVNAFCYYIIIL